MLASWYKIKDHLFPKAPQLQCQGDMQRQAALSPKGLTDWILAIWIPCCPPIAHKPTSCKIYQCSKYTSVLSFWSQTSCKSASQHKWANMLSCTVLDMLQFWAMELFPTHTHKPQGGNMAHLHWALLTFYTQEQIKLVLQPIRTKTMSIVLFILILLFLID